MTLFAGASAIAFKKSIDAASNLTEQINKARVVFRGAEKEVLAWSETTSKSIGISQRAALEFAGTFGNMLVPMGFARQEAAKMSTQLVDLAADMASFNNADPTEVLEALRAGLAGETEPLRRFGIFLNEARIKQEALNAGLVQGKEELTAAGKAASIYRIILKDTADSQGDFARTSDSLANSQRTLRAQLEDVAAKVGAVFLPAVTSAMNAVNKWLGNEENVRMLERWAKTLQDGVATALRGIAGWVRDNREGIVRFFRETADFAGDAAETIGEIAGAADDVSKAVGGWDQVFKFVAIHAALKQLIGTAATAGVAGTGLLGATKGAGRLFTSLKALSTLGMITIGIQLLLNKDDREKLGDWLNKNLPGDLDFNKGLGDAWDSVTGAKAAQTTATAPATGAADTAADKAAMSSKGAKLAAKYGGLQAGTTALAGFVESSGGRINAGREGGHSPTGGHGVGESLDINWANNGPKIWAALFPHRAKFRLLLGPPGLYMWGQQYQNERDRKNHQAHIHVQYQGSAAELRKLLGDKAPEITGATGIVPGSDYLPADTTADTSTTGTGGTAAKKATIDAGELSRAQSKAGWIEKNADLITSPTMRARLRQRAANIARTLEEVTEPKAFATAVRNLNALDRDWEKALELNAATKQARATARNIGVALGRMPEAMEKELGPRLAAVNRALGNVTSKGQLARIQKDMDALNAAIKAGVDKMRQTVERGRDTVGRALSGAADKALQVLDAKTEELLKKARVMVGGEMVGEGDLGPAGRALRDFRAARAAATLAATRTARLAELATAKAEETEEEKAERLRQLAAYNAEITLEDREAELERLATLEAEKAATALEAERARIRDERTILKERFQARYDEIVRGFQNETLTAEQAQQQLLALLGDPAWSADFANAGALIGQAFANSFTNAISGLAAAVDALRQSINAVSDATGAPRELPDGSAEEAWQTALRVRSEGMNKKYAGLIAKARRQYVSPRNLVSSAETASGGGGSVSPGGGGTPVVDLRGSLFLGANKEVAAFIGEQLAGSTVAVSHLAKPLTDEQARQIGYRSQAI